MDAQDTPLIDDSVETIIDDEGSEPLTVGKEDSSEDEDNLVSEDDAGADEDIDDRD